MVECSNTRGEPSVFLNVEGCALDIFRETSRELTSRNYVISIRPLLVLKNCLPVPLFYACGNQDRFRPLQEGERVMCYGFLDPYVDTPLCKSPCLERRN